MLRKDPTAGGGGAAPQGGDRLLPDRSSMLGPGPGRRPLLSTFEGNNRQMLMDLKNSLQTATATSDHLGGKSELSHSTPNLLDTTNKNSVPFSTTNGPATTNGNNNVLSARDKMSRMQYNQLAMAAIHKSIEQFAVSDNGGSTSNHCYIANGMEIEVTPVNKKMLQQLMSMGEDEDVATRALKISGNKSVDDALDAIHKLSNYDGRNGFNKAAAGLQGYGSKVMRKPSFEEKYGKCSPVHSENSSIRSESPNLGLNRPPSYHQRGYQHMVNGDASQPQTMHHISLTVPPGSQQQHPGLSERQASPPPPLPPRSVHASPAPPPVPPQTYKSPAPPPLSRRMSPVTRDSPYRGAPSPAGGSITNGGPVTPQRGMSPSALHQQQHNPHHQPVIKQPHQLYNGSMYGGDRTSAAAALLQTHAQNQLQNAPPLEDSGYASSGSGGQGPRHRNPPPPYQHVLPSKPQQSAFYSSELHQQHQQQQQQQQQMGNGVNSSSPLSSHSPSPAPTPQSHSPMIHPGNHKHPVAVQAWNAKQPPIIMQQVKSREVPKPILQTATAPMSPAAPQRQYAMPVNSVEQLASMQQQHQQGLASQNNQYSYISEVSTRVNQPHLQIDLPSANNGTSNGAQSHSNNLDQQQHAYYAQQQQQQPSAHYPPQNIHSVQIRKGSIEHIVNNNSGYGINGNNLHHHSQQQQQQQQQYHPPPPPHPGRTINIHIENSGSANHTIQVQPGYGVTHYSTSGANGVGEPRVPPLHPGLYGGGVDSTPGSTPRSNSPVSRALNNHSPQSVISTTSTPSTNSDIPDKPPPPYPGKFYHPQGQQQQQHLPHQQQQQQQQPMMHLQYMYNNPVAMQQQQFASNGGLGGGGGGGLCSETSSTTSSNYASSNYTDVKSTTSSNYTDISARFEVVNPMIQEEAVVAQTSSLCDMTPLVIELPPPEYPHRGGATNSEVRDPSQQSQTEKTPLVSPRPVRKADAKRKDEERRMSKVKNYSPQAFKFYIEQHIENVLKSYQQRINRRMQLENEMNKVGLSEEAQSQMRKMLNQKESNYIRLKRAKMDKSMFDKIKTLGIGAFGEVALVRKKDTGALNAMKTLRKQDVLQRNQAAHVKAERDILAEADNDWVVKLYYSFQDKSNLYFVMDYIPGGDMMSLLIKKGIFEEPLAQFYIAELVLAIESVHAMGFIHRDIKPDNILIDKDGHIKLTDFGLCTGFRWTHDSKYYQKSNHVRQDSMEPTDEWGTLNNCQCGGAGATGGGIGSTKEVLKPLERRKLRHQRCLAHSLVGTPNYIAPEVLQRAGYTKVCDWWSVGVILFEMLVGQPPFMANTPQETQLKVINWQKTLQVPEEAHISAASSDLIMRLCCAPDSRLGVKGADEIKAQPFFHNVAFETLRRQKAPYIPKIRYQTDTSNFDPVDPDKIKSSGSCDSLDTLKHDGTGGGGAGGGGGSAGGGNGKHPDHAFFEFTFRRFFDDGGHPMPSAKLTGPPNGDTSGPVYV